MSGDVAASTRDPGPALARYVIAWAGTGAVACAAVVAWGWRTGSPATSPWTLLVLVVAMAVSGSISITVPVRGTTEGHNPNELAVVPVVVLLPPPLAVAVAALGMLASEIVLSRLELRKIVFNLGWELAGIALGSVLWWGVVGQRFTAEPPLALLVAFGVGLVYVAVNGLALAGLHHLFSGRSVATILRSDTLASAVVGVTTVGLGVLAVVLVTTAPWALPLLGLLLLFDADRARARLLVYDQVVEQQTRFARTVDGASDGVVLLDGGGRVEVWNGAMAALTGVGADDAVGASPGELGLDALVPDDDHTATRRELADRVVEIRPAPVGRAGEVVLLVTDVTREAELARIREDLVDRISHEVRTPVTTASGLMAMLDDQYDRLDEDRRRRMVSGAARGARRLSSLVDNLAVLARIDVHPGGAHGSGMVTTAVRPVVERVLRDPAGAGVTVSGAVLDAVVRMAPDDLETVLRNLLRNAHAYGAAPVDLAVSAADGTVEVAVTDCGPGVPDDFTDRVFDAFAQASDGLRRTATGLGVGLTVVQSLVVANGGTVHHERPEAGGARFVVRLPVAD